MSALRLAALLASLSLAQALLAGCGSGGGSASASSTAATTGPTQAGGSAAFAGPHPSPTAQTHAERARAGNAASFVEPGADNSVPTFGSEASVAERVEAERNLRAYLTARAARQWAKACSLLAASIRQGYERLATSKGAASCSKLIRISAPLKPGEPANLLRGSLLAFRVQGAHAFALFYGAPAHQAYVVPMNREAGAWRPTQTAPIAYPPGAP